MEMESLRELFVHELKDVWSAEKQILQALPKMIRAAEHPQLAEALEEHRRITEGQVVRLDRILAGFDKTGRSNKKCKGMEGILEEGEELLQKKDDVDLEVLQAGIIASAQKVEHYEIATYGTLVAYARLLNETEAVELLEQTLAEEKEADQKLSALAEESINLEAAA